VNGRGRASIRAYRQVGSFLLTLSRILAPAKTGLALCRPLQGILLPHAGRSALHVSNKRTVR
jgi:hypothetical protein